MAARVDASWAVAFSISALATASPPVPGGLHLDRIDDHGAVFVAQSQQIATFAGIGKAQPQPCETRVDGYEERLRITLPVVAGGDQHAGETQHPGGIGLAVGPKEADESVAQQDDAFLEKFLQFLRGEAEIELV